MLEQIHWSSVLITIAVLGSIGFSLFMLILAIHCSRRDLDESDSTELSERNVPPPKFDPPFLKLVR